MNPKRRRNRSHRPKAKYRRRRRNPTSYRKRASRMMGGLFNPKRKYRRRRGRNANPVHYRRRRRHNPFGISGGEIVKTAAWAIAGGVATRALPQMFLSQYNTGLMGYGMNLLTAGGLAWLGERFMGPTAGRGILIGGLVMLGGRIVSDYFGKDLVTFGGGLLGDYGDPSFDLGLYEPNQFVIPTVSTGPFQKTDYAGMLPAPVVAMPGKSAKGAPAPAAGVGAYQATGRFASRFAA